TGGDAFVTWYDRRAATSCPSPPCAASNDLTDYFAAGAGLDAAGNLIVNNDEFRISKISDQQCDAARWPAPPPSMADSENCSTQPQLAGICCSAPLTNNACAAPAAGGSPCDFSSTVCPSGQTCRTGGGVPKYGDYNGNACAVGRLFAVFASASQTGPTGPINNFFQASLVSGPQIQVPGNVAVSDTCVGSTNTATLNVCNTGVDNLQVNSISSSNTQFVVTTPSSGYPVVISPDFCFPFQVRFTPTSTGTKTTTLTIASNDPANPSVTVQATGNGTLLQHIATVIADNGNFGNVCLGAFKDLN